MRLEITARAELTATHAERGVGERAGWRAVAMPSEHGGWGLTLEPVLLGLLVAWSGAGVALGVAAFTAFLLRTPAKLVAIDLRRGRWLDLEARAIGAIPFVGVQILRLRHGQGPVWQSDLAQVAAVAVTAVAVIVDRRLLLGLAGVALLTVTQYVWVRRAPIPAKQVGLRQMAMGMALVAGTAVGVLW